MYAIVWVEFMSVYGLGELAVKRLLCYLCLCASHGHARPSAAAIVSMVVKREDAALLSVIVCL